MWFLYLGQALDSWDHGATSTLLSLMPEVGLTTLLPNVLGWRFVWVPDNLNDTVVCMCVTWKALACSGRGSSHKVAENTALWRKERGITTDYRHFPLWVRGSISFNYLGAEVGAMYPYCGKENLGSGRVSNLPQVCVASKQWSWTQICLIPSLCSTSIPRLSKGLNSSVEEFGTIGSHLGFCTEAGKIENWVWGRLLFVSWVGEEL